MTARSEVLFMLCIVVAGAMIGLACITPGLEKIELCAIAGLNVAAAVLLLCPKEPGK